MNTPQFGLFLSPRVADLDRVRDSARAAEAAGFDFISVQDHPYVPDHLDTLALIGTLIGTTERIRFLTNVANLPLRPPQMLAKAAASLDLLSGGRFDLGLGAGRLWPQIAGLGGPIRTPAEAFGATAEAIGVLRSLWQPDGVTDLPGEYYPVTAASGPAPAHRIGIWLGAAGPRMLDLLGRAADGWIAPLATGYETKPAAQDRIDAAARAAGRDPRAVRRAIQLVGMITDRPRTGGRPLSGPGGQPIRATAEQWASIIGEFLATERFDTVNLVLEQTSEEQLRRFGDEVFPAVRGAVSASA